MKIKYVLMISVFSLLMSCDFSTVELDVKQISEMPGELDTIPDSTALEMVSFSGFNPDSNQIWTQTIAYQLPERRLIRIITPQQYGIKVEEKMVYRKINIDFMMAETIDVTGLGGDIEGESLEKVLKIFSELGKSSLADKINYDTVKVFFNPKFKETENQNLPIVVGKLETLDGHSLGFKFIK